MSRTVSTPTQNIFPLTTQVVTSSFGFQSGDYVYLRQNGDISSIPNNPGVNGLFEATAVTPIGATNYSTGGGYATVFNVAGRGRKAKTSDVLSNGNIVQVWCNNSDQYPSFRIIDSSDAEVVAATQITSNTNFLPNAARMIGVCAFPNGNFVVYWFGPSSYLCWAVYSNTGTLVTAAQRDTTWTMNASTEFLATAANSVTDQIAFITYNNAGAPRIFWWTNTGTVTNAATLGSTIYNGFYDVACNSDGYTMFVGTNTARTEVLYYVYNSSNTSVASGSYAITGSVRQTSIAALANKNFVIVTANNTNTVYVNTYTPTANTFSGVATLFTDTLSIWNTASVTAMSNNRFFVITANSGANTNYRIFNSSYVLQNVRTFLYTVNLTSTFIKGFEANGVLQFTFDTGPQQNTSTGFGLARLAVNTTTYRPINTPTLTLNLGNVSAPLGNYVRSASTATLANFYTSTNTTATITNSQTNLSNASTYVLQPTRISNGSAYTYQLAMVTMKNGDYVIFWHSSTSNDGAQYNIYGTVYSYLGVFKSQFLVTNLATTSAQNAIQACITADNYLVVAIASTTASTQNIFVYDSTYTLYSSFNITTFASSGNTNSINDCICLSGTRYNGQFVISGKNASTFPAFAVYNISGSTVVSATQVNGNATNNVVCCALPSGILYIVGLQTNTLTYWTYFDNGSGTSYTAFGGSSTVAGTLYTPIRITADSAGCAYLTANASTGSLSTIFGPGGGTISTTTLTTSTTTNQLNQAVAITANGLLLLGNPNASAGGVFLIYAKDSQNNTVTTLSSAPPINTIGYSNLAMSGGYGNNVGIAFFENTSQRVVFCIVNAADNSFQYTVTTGIDVSVSGISLAQNTGYLLQGVSATAASAGGTGTIISSGSAQLNSNYSNSFGGAFDFTVNGISGVKGTYNGRNVLLQGNK